MRQKQYSWIFNGCSEKLYVKDKLHLLDYVSLKQNLYIEFYIYIFSSYFNSHDSKNFTLWRIVTIVRLFLFLNYNIKYLGLTIWTCMRMAEDTFVTLDLYLTDIEWYFHLANFCFCSPMSTKLRVSIHDDIRFPNLHFSSVYDSETSR